MKKILLLLSIIITNTVFAQRQVPNGGTSGQVLKIKPDGYNLQWGTLSGISGLTNTYIPKATSATTLGNSVLSESWQGIVNSKKYIAADSAVYFQIQNGGYAGTYSVDNHRVIQLTPTNVTMSLTDGATHSGAIDIDVDRTAVFHTDSILFNGGVYNFAPNGSNLSGSGGSGNVAYLNSNSTLKLSATTNTELERLTGVTSNVQVQLDSLESKRLKHNISASYIPYAASTDSIVNSYAYQDVNGFYVYPFNSGFQATADEVYSYADSTIIFDAPKVRISQAPAYANVSDTTVSKVLFRNVVTGNIEWGAISGGGNALTSNPLSQFAATTSAQLAGVITNETGSGLAVFATSPTLTTPLLGTPTSGTLTNCTGLPISTGVSGLGTGVATWAATPSSANLASAITDETGTGVLVYSASPALTGTPTAPTAATTTNSTQIATTAYVQANKGSGVITVTSGTSFTTPAGTTTATRYNIILIGAGGGAGGINTVSGKGSAGGAGGGLKVSLTGLTASTTYTCAIGVGGTGGTGAANGTAGTATTLTVGATTYTANGGGLGIGAISSTGGAGGTATNGDINVTGQDGGDSPAASAASTDAKGGDSPWGWGFGGAPVKSGNGRNGTGYGSGGGGAAGSGSPTGGNGMNGIIYCEWFN